MLALQYQLSEAEFFDYHYHTTWASASRRRYRRWYYARIFILYTLVAAAYIIVNHSHNLIVDIAIFSIIALLYFSMVPYLVKKSIRRRVDQMLREEENKHLLETAGVEISDEGILYTDSESETKYKWEAIVKMDQSALSYFLHTNSYHAIVIPKKLLDAPADKAEWKRILNQHLPIELDWKNE
jgi:hypothetical protein